MSDDIDTTNPSSTLTVAQLLEAALDWGIGHGRALGSDPEIQDSVQNGQPFGNFVGPDMLWEHLDPDDFPPDDVYAAETVAARVAKDVGDVLTRPKRLKTEATGETISVKHMGNLLDQPEVVVHALLEAGELAGDASGITLNSFERLIERAGHGTPSPQSYSRELRERVKCEPAEAGEQPWDQVVLGYDDNEVLRSISTYPNWKSAIEALDSLRAMQPERKWVWYPMDGRLNLFDEE